MERPTLNIKNIARKDIIKLLEHGISNGIALYNTMVIKGKYVSVELCDLNYSIFEGCIFTLENEDEIAFYFDDIKTLKYYKGINEEIVM